MITSEKTQKARKKAQMARLAMKGTPEYPAMYAAQPEQVRKAAEYKAIRKAERDAKHAFSDTAELDALAAVDVFSSMEVK